MSMFNLKESSRKRDKEACDDMNHVMDIIFNKQPDISTYEICWNMLDFINSYCHEGFKYSSLNNGNILLSICSEEVELESIFKLPEGIATLFHKVSLQINKGMEGC